VVSFSLTFEQRLQNFAISAKKKRRARASRKKTK